jgi:formylmethanofuran dehydrogenase subunit D
MPTFTSAQQAQLDRMSSSRRAEMNDDVLATLSVDELRARVNVVSVAGTTITYASENNYTSEQQGWIANAAPFRRWTEEIASAVTRGTALKTAGRTTSEINAILG